MAEIKQLDAFVANRIAAGEVVERPLSVVKELVENAIDAKASAISIEIIQGGIQRIRVTDNGKGIAFQEALLAFERHATSKVYTAQDLDAIATLGFRGEALSSVASVAQVDMQTHVKQAETGAHVRIEGGKLIDYSPSGCPDGTVMLVENIFFNTPARLHFLKKPALEGAGIGDYIARMIMANPSISFKFINNDKVIYHSRGDGELINAVYCVYGRDVLATLKSVQYQDDLLKIDGFISMSDGSKPNRTYQSFFVNGRYIQSAMLSQAIQEAFGTRLMGGRFPLCVLNISVPFSEVDVNIHPNKLAIRFKEEEKAKQGMRLAIENAIGNQTIFSWPTPNEQASTFTSTAPAQKDSVVSETMIKNEKTLNEKDSKEIDELFSGQEEKQTEEKTEKSILDQFYAKTFDFQEAESGTIYAKEPVSVSMPVQESIVAPLFIEEQFQIIGQVFATYILIQQNDVLYLIDQHAGHERLLFDRIQKQAKQIESQVMVEGIEVVLTPMQKERLKQNEILLKQIGFDWQEEAHNAVTLRSVPHFFGKAESAQFLPDVLDGLEKSSIELKKDVLAQYACKHAIKGNQKLSKREIQELVQQFNELNEYHCPHGRPIMVKITQRDLEKIFKRIP